MVEIKSKICYNKGSQKARIKVSSFNNSVMYFLNNVMYSDDSPTEEVGLFCIQKEYIGANVRLNLLPKYVKI